MNKSHILLLFIVLSINVNAQKYLAAENDTTTLTEYNDGRIWAYRQIGDFVVGMTNYVDNDGYGKNYQIQIFIKNLSAYAVTFNPELVSSTIYNKCGDTTKMKVYSYERYMKKVKNQQAWAMALTGFATGMNAGMAGYQTTYTTSSPGHTPYTQVSTTYNYSAASAANLAASTQIMKLGMIMSDDKKTISQGYLKKTTIHPNEGIIGYMNIKHRKGRRMMVNIPIGFQVFSFEWDIEKKKEIKQ